MSSSDETTTAGSFGPPSSRELEHQSPPPQMPRTSRHCEITLDQTTERGFLQAQLRATAARDIEDARSYYRAEAGLDTALAFVDALEAAIAELCSHPNIGTLRFAFELEIPDLGSWSLRRFPHLAFYVPDHDRIDIWRVLHARRDSPAFLTADSPT